MKTITSIMAVLLIASGFSQGLPKNNEIILKFAEKRHKHHVKVRWWRGGSCASLALKAISKTENNSRYVLRAGDGKYGNWIKDVKDILPGDLILFNNFTATMHRDTAWMLKVGPDCIEQAAADTTSDNWEFFKEFDRKRWIETIKNHVGIVSSIIWDGDNYSLKFIDQSNNHWSVCRGGFDSNEIVNDKFTIRRVE
tara:strand:+ start:3740 stop:4327 length:588 start_codon:yes stop_codon:yes gene_type:complete